MTAALCGGVLVSLGRLLRQPSPENSAGEDGRSEEASRERRKKGRNMSSGTIRRGEN